MKPRVRRVGKMLLAAGLLLLGSIVIAPSQAGADGNNGTVKIDNTSVTGNDHGQGNDPHVGCTFDVEWFGFDAPLPEDPPKNVTATVSFEAQNPTGTGLIHLVPNPDNTINFTGSGTAGNLDFSKPYDLSSALFSTPGLTVHKQGFHIKVTINTTTSNGSDVKAKTYWVQACNPPEPAKGSITVDKALAGDGDLPLTSDTFQFTISNCPEGTTFPNGNPVNIAAADGAVTVAENIPVGETCDVTETQFSTGKTPTSTSFTGGDGVGPVSIGPATATSPGAVLFTNTYIASTTTTSTATTLGLLPTSVVTGAPAEVLGEEVTRPATLARTGTREDRRLLVAVTLMFIGLVFLGSSKRLELAHARSGAMASRDRQTPQHAASRSTLSSAWLAVGAAGSAILARIRRR